MERTVIKDKIKQIIFETTNIKVEDIENTAHFKQDMNLDSLTLLEIAVNIEQEFGLDVPEEEMEKFTDVETSANLVLEYLAVVGQT